MLGANPLRRPLRALALVVLTMTAAWGSPARAGSPSRDVSVQFTDSVESIGVALLPTDLVRAMVPTEFILAGEGTPVTPIVVRTAQSDRISVDGQQSRPGTIVQIGAVIVPPDFTGDINNYTLWYNTSDASLASRLNRAGVPAQHVSQIRYQYESCRNTPARFHVAVPRPGQPPLRLNGHVAASTAPAGSFVANWWVKGPHGRVKMTTSVPTILVGTADLVLQTPPRSDLGRLIGGDTLDFPILQQFNTFPAARMQVSRVAP